MDLSPFPLQAILSYFLCPGATAGELIVVVPLSVPAPVQAIKHMVFGGPEDLRGLTEGNLTEGKQLANKIPCVQKKKSLKENQAQRGHCFQGEWPGRCPWAGSCLNREDKVQPCQSPTAPVPSYSHQPFCSLPVLRLIVCGLVHSLGNVILVDQKMFCSFVSFPASVSLGG